jgi:zinc D-Ala-D-Ala carboxypeptidase
VSVYFKEIEDNMNVAFLAKLDEARRIAGIPFHINSAFRTPEKNAEVGGKSNSSHLRGLAVDISTTDSRTRFIVLQSLIAAGFTRMGVASNFIHVDDDKEKSQNVVWTY